MKMNRKTGLPRWVHEYVDPHGKVRVRFRAPRGDRRPHYFRARFPSPEFFAEYHQCVEAMEAGRPAAPTSRAGTVGELFDRYLQSPEWLGHAVSTNLSQGPLIEKVRAVIGSHPARELGYAEASALLALYADRPSQRNKVKKIMHAVWKEGERWGLVPSNPWRLTRRVKEKGDGFPAWTAEEVQAFRDHWPVGTTQRLALELNIFIGQRRGDLHLLGPANLRDGWIELVQSKTGKAVAVPISSELEAIIAATPTEPDTFLVTEKGKPFTTPDSLGMWFGRACKAAGVTRKGVRLHGLRRFVMTELAESGATQQQIKAISGHSHDAEVRLYVQSADKRRLAREAVALRSMPEAKSGLRAA